MFFYLLSFYKLSKQNLYKRFAGEDPAQGGHKALGAAGVEGGLPRPPGEWVNNDNNNNNDDNIY